MDRPEKNYSEFEFGPELRHYITVLFGQGLEAASSLDLGVAHRDIQFKKLVADLNEAFNALCLRDMFSNTKMVRAISENLLSDDDLFEAMDRFEYFLPTKDPSTGYYESDENKERMFVLSALISVFQYAGLMGGQWKLTRYDTDKLKDEKDG